MTETQLRASVSHVWNRLQRSKASAFTSVLLAASTVAASEGTTSSLTGEPGATALDLVQVTATRFGEPIQEVPESVERLTGEELRARGATDLRSALALLGGVTVAPGGDEGPGAAVPGLLGLREVDDFLLVIDGVPVGGPFNPQFSTLDISNIERIEVQRGPASVFFGTTAFAGTINIIHYPAGKAERQVRARYGSYGSASLSGSTVLSEGVINQSISADGIRERYPDSRSGLDRVHGLYRLGTQLGGGELRIDLDTAVQHQRPNSPVVIESGDVDDGPVDRNQNPADAKIDTSRFQLNTGYDRRVVWGNWGSTLSLAQTHLQQVRGFLAAEEAAGPADATGFHQRRDTGELFFDTHLTHRFTSNIVTTVGLNELYGLSHQTTDEFAYSVSPDGSLPPSSTAATPGDHTTLSDLRNFLGLYTQTRWMVTPRIGVLAGLRLNHTDERRTVSDPDDTLKQGANSTRLSGSVGIHWRVWQDAEADLDDVVLYTNYGNTFQPPQIAFGPEEQHDPLLRPETAQSLQFGIKADGNDGRFSADLAAFLVNFRNQPLLVPDGNLGTLASGGAERFAGAELELAYQLLRALSINANVSYNDARYRGFATQIDGSPVQLRGNRVPLTAPVLAAAGLVYGETTGIRASVTANFVGRRPLDAQNARSSKAYVSLDTTLGYGYGRYGLELQATNLTNRRAPVLASELGEGQFYVLPARRFFIQIKSGF